MPDNAQALDREQMKQRIAREIEKARSARTPLTLGMFDIDRFHEFNQAHGRQAGDGLIAALIATLAKHCGEKEPFARWGGDEFCAIFPGLDLERAFLKAEAIRNDFNSATNPGGEKGANAFLSAGLAAFPRDGRNTDELLKSADSALFKAKRLGRNRVSLPEDERDPLTGLYSMKSLQGLLDEEIRKAQLDGAAVSFGIVDVDDFLKINDTLGHREGGDRLMEMIAKTCAEVLPEGAVLGRHGGDDFCFILPGLEVERAFLEMEKLREYIATHPFEISRKDGDIEVNITVSGGVASFPQHGKSAAEVIRCADSGLYRAKDGNEDELLHRDRTGTAGAPRQEARRERGIAVARSPRRLAGEIR